MLRLKKWLLLWLAAQLGLPRLTGCLYMQAVEIATGKVLWREYANNGDTDVGLTDILSVYFGAGTQKTTWYIGLIKDTSYSGIAASDTMASHAGWLEWTAYDETVRQTWVVGAASGKAISHSSLCSVTPNETASGRIKGGFVTSVNTKSGTLGVLAATSLFNTPKDVATGVALQFGWTKTLAAA